MTRTSTYNPADSAAKRGPKSFVDTMTEEQRTEYRTNLEYIRQLVAMGKLKRGWQTRIAPGTGYTTAAISQVYTGSFISPPVLAAIYPRVLEEVGMPEPHFMPEKVAQVEHLMSEIDREIAALKDRRQNAIWKFQEDMVQLQQRHERALAGYDKQIQLLEGSHDAARERYEELEMKRQDEEWQMRFGE